MGLLNFPSPAEGVLPVLVMNTVLSVALLKNMVRSVLHVVVGATSSNLDEDSSSSSSLLSSSNDETSENGTSQRSRRISISRYESFCKSRRDIETSTSNSSSSSSSSRNGGSNGDDGNMLMTPMECCCVCLCRFEADEVVSELSCKHFFHKCCLEKWFDNQHTTCPLCRSIM